MTKYAFNTKLNTKNFSGKVFIIPRVTHQNPANPSMCKEAGVLGDATRLDKGSYNVSRLIGGRLYWHHTSIAEGVEVLGKLSREEDIEKLHSLVGKKVKIKPFTPSANSVETSAMKTTIGSVGKVTRVVDDGGEFCASATILVTFKDGSEWWYTPDNLKVVKPKLKVGDLVVAESAPYLITAGKGRLMEVVKVFDKPEEDGDDIKVRVIADGVTPYHTQGAEYSVNSKHFKLFTKKV